VKLCLGPAAVAGGTPAPIAYSRTLGIPTVLESSNAVPGVHDTQRMDARRLREFQRQFVDGGVEIVALNTAPLYPSTIGGGSATEAALATNSSVFEAMAEVGIPTFTQTLRIPKLPQPAADEQFKRLADYYAALCAAAERCRVRIGTHSTWSPETNGWMWGAREFARLFEAVPSRACGFTYDNAILAMLGDDPAGAVERFGDRIVFCHIRDVRRAADGRGVQETGYDETFPGAGEMDFRATFRALRAAGYGGGLQPEHLPRLPDDPVATAAVSYAFGYFEALLEETL
jgi:sugar phosphate isomerase/epimerase